MQILTFTIVDTGRAPAYTITKLQGIPKTEYQSEPETETENPKPSKDTSKEIYYIQGKVKKIVYTRITIPKLIFTVGYEPK